MKHGVLRERIHIKYGTQKKFAKELGISAVSLSSKLTGNTDFKASEIKKAIDLLDIEKEEISKFFLGK